MCAADGISPINKSLYLIRKSIHGSFVAQGEFCMRNLTSGNTFRCSAKQAIHNSGAINEAD